MITTWKSTFGSLFALGGGLLLGEVLSNHALLILLWRLNMCQLFKILRSSVAQEIRNRHHDTYIFIAFELSHDNSGTMTITKKPRSRDRCKYI